MWKQNEGAFFWGMLCMQTWEDISIPSTRYDEYGLSVRACLRERVCLLFHSISFPELSIPIDCSGLWLSEALSSEQAFPQMYFQSFLESFVNRSGAESAVV